MNIPNSSLKRVVIIGGGFGGLSLAKNLKRADFQVVLLDRHNYHAFQPLFYQVATAGLDPGSIAYPFRKILSQLKEFYFRMAEVEFIDTAKNKLMTNIGELSYDYLIIATGAKPNFFGLNNVQKWAMPMKSISDALDIRSLMLQNLENSILSASVKEREALMSIIIVGGGPTGVELAGAIAELRKDILPSDYPDLDIRAMDIHLVEANSRLIKEMHEESSKRAFETLKDMGVDIWLNTRVADYDGTSITTTDGRKLNGSMLIWAAGVMASIPEGIPDESKVAGRIAVDLYNRVKTVNNVFAIGDVARMASEENPNGHPMLAQPAMQQGQLLAANLQALRDGKEMVVFKYQNKGTMATIGRAEAVTEIGKIRLQGWLAWMAWLLVHVYQLIGFRNKLAVILNWSQNYFRHARDLRLIIRPFQRKS